MAWRAVGPEPTARRVLRWSKSSSSNSSSSRGEVDVIIEEDIGMKMKDDERWDAGEREESRKNNSNGDGESSSPEEQPVRSPSETMR